MKNHASQKALYKATYFKNIAEKKIFVVGLEPPPLGGVSVHILRKIQYLKKKNQVFLFDVIKKGKNKSKFSCAITLARSLFCFKRFFLVHGSFWWNTVCAFYINVPIFIRNGSTS